MRIDPRAADRVQVLADIDERAPISESTVAELSLQGVTGLLYIDLLASAGNKASALAWPSLRRSSYWVQSSSNLDVPAAGVTGFGFGCRWMFGAVCSRLVTAAFPASRWKLKN
ncbi:MAG TPA: hypothetical protein PK159_10845, partial [Steroidobacteraceae bacterium]|nr:hypothetical protein [Steroidobacteraceae bacterium]